MRTDTQTVSIESPTAMTFAFVADPANLPRWAIGFAKSVEADGDRWLVTTGQGVVPLRCRAHPDVGVVDWHLALDGGVEAVVHSRILPRGAGAEYVFTQLQPPGMPDEVFDAQVEALGHELVTLKALLEVACPL